MTATLARWPRAFTGSVMRLRVSGGPSVAGVRCGCGPVRGAGRPARRGGGPGRCVSADAVAAVEVAAAVGAVAGRPQSHRVLAQRPAGPVAGPDRQRPELVEGEAPVRVMAGHVLDPVQLGVPVRITGLFPGPGPLE